MGRSSDFTSLLAVYAIRTHGGVGGPPREGRSYPYRCSSSSYLNSLILGMNAAGFGQ